MPLYRPSEMRKDARYTTKEPTLADKLAAVKAKYPYAQFPSDFGQNPADAVALDRLSSNIPKWAQKAGAKVSEFFGAGSPKNNEILSRVGSMRPAGSGNSVSDVQYKGLLAAGRLVVDNVVPGGGAGRVGRILTRADELYNAEMKGIGMSARGVNSARSMLGDVVEMSGYMANPNGGYLTSGDVDKEMVGQIYEEASARGLDPVMVARERLPYAMFEASDAGRKYSEQQAEYGKPIWQNDDGSYVSARDLEEGPNAVTKSSRYVPKFMETSGNRT